MRLAPLNNTTPVKQQHPREYGGAVGWWVVGWGLWAGAPAIENCTQIDHVDDPVFINVGIGIIASPKLKHNKQVGDTNMPISIDIRT